MTVAQAIAKMEGFNVPGSRAQRNNNPGNLNFAPYMMHKYGARLETGAVNNRFAFFPDVPTGWNALQDLLETHYAGMTIEAAFNKYAPPVENATNYYIANVCRWCELKPTDLLTSEMISGQVQNDLV